MFPDAHDDCWISRRALASGFCSEDVSLAAELFQRVLWTNEKMLLSAAKAELWIDGKLCTRSATPRHLCLAHVCCLFIAIKYNTRDVEPVSTTKYLLRSLKITCTWHRFLDVEVRMLRALDYRLSFLQARCPSTTSNTETPTCSLQNGHLTTAASQSSLQQHTLGSNLTTHPQHSSVPQQAMVATAALH